MVLPAPRVSKGEVRAVSGKCASCGSTHTVTYRDGRWSAEACKSLRPEPGVKPQGRLPGPSREAPVLSKPGLDNEIALAKALLEAGLTDYEVQYPWGLMLKPARKYVADVFYVKARVAVESVGGAHAAGREKVYKDAERSALAASLGILVVPLHPGMVHDGVGVELVRKAIESRATRGEG